MTFKELGEKTLGESLNEKSDEDLENIKEAARGELIRSYATVNKHIDDSTSATLKRLIKFLTGSADVQHMITGKKLELNEKENSILDDLFEFSRTQIGFTALLNEINENDNTTEEKSNE